MRIVITHLTRMSKGFCCVAGLHETKGQSIRPVLAGGVRLSTNFLAPHGGPFEMGALVDLGKTRNVGCRPEIEDREFQPDDAQQVRLLDEKAFWKSLTESAEKSLDEIFGDDFESKGPNSAGVDKGKGSASLGCLRPRGKPRLYLRDHQHKEGLREIRLKVEDQSYDLDLGVTDIRLYGPDHVTPDETRVAKVASRIAKGEKLLLSVGLTRAMKSSRPEFPDTHWLQINNLHLVDDPLWSLADSQP